MPRRTTAQAAETALRDALLAVQHGRSRLGIQLADQLRPLVRAACLAAEIRAHEGNLSRAAAAAGIPHRTAAALVADDPRLAAELAAERPPR